MIIEILTLFLLIGAAGIIIFCLLAAIYGRNRPTKFLLSITPSIITVTVASFALGKLGTNNYSAVTMAFAVSVLAIVGNFILIRNKLTKPLSRITYGLNSGGDQVAVASNQVFTASRSLAEGATEQAAGLEETAASIEEIASMTAQNADNTQHARSMTEEANRIVKSVTSHMEEMDKAISESIKTSEETGRIIKTIDEIAFQTNLLALNAAVEAARAGEAGAGFAVVADEVRNLAMRAAEAAKNTSSLIENTIKSVKNGNTLSLATQEAFTKNVEITKRISELIDGFAISSKEQAEGIAQVNLNVAEMDKVTQHNAANAEELTAAAGDTSDQATHMKEFVGELVTLFGVGEKGTLAEARKIVKKGIAYLKTHGEKKSLAEISNPRGKFVDRDLYISVYDRTGNVVAHGWDSEIVGKNVMEIRDADGKLFIQEILEIADSKGSGLVTYSYMNPVLKKIQPKAVYFKKASDLIFAAGAYD